MSTADFAAFHDLHHGAEPLLLPNAWDHAGAAALVAAGFPAIGTTSLGVAAAHGLPDGEGRTREQTVALARRLTQLPCLLTVDVEGGFSGDAGEVSELALELAEAGVVGVNIEDGRGEGTLADPGAQAGLITAIKDRVPGLFVNARVDTYWLGVDTGSLAPTLDRARRYADAGADGIFVPGRLPDIAAVAEGVDLPLNVLYLPGGPSVAELGQLGVRRVSTGSLLFRTALGATVDTAVAIRDGSEPALAAPSYSDVQRLIG
ncbi:isocitrate lyase/phosphoenolpyruvate mutase family protein [Prauserella sp. PE36]|uniref:isocitrate lyase/PEP mutase family protein n=1 Tax=Prauserella sp. PE36 TaxID=1504709 RepID=UPI000DE54B38|nr:isocitrate lyase/phosphoenolpyruvate mutase family protein [Prauserella sp. PE36]RBM10266.1 isocitrate lyase/phosphoenolpyruvate mutase family protein [Prauserella sp. PE36]